MYYPYFRGKQYELITIRETAALFAAAGFVPIIEPVREQISGLRKTLDVLCEEDATAIVIVNPGVGDLSDDGSSIVDLIREHFGDSANVILGLLLTEKMTADDVVAACDRHNNRQIALIHSGFSDAKGLAQSLNGYQNVSTSVFLDDKCGRLYQSHFEYHDTRVLVHDGFRQRTNRKHPDTAEFFSELHATFADQNMGGFGDFLMVGADYSETGGPAFTIAIHLTYIDADKDDVMQIRHFKSDRQDTPKDPAGKFAEALVKLIGAIEEDGSKFINTSAIEEFRDLHNRGHYPGLGYVKKLSMKHHVETLAAYFEVGRAAG